ncbi:MAG: ribonuclease III domain-containing protein [Candidatus Thorarchaeota archaeon]|jgi:ribonuclease-3
MGANSDLTLSWKPIQLVNRMKDLADTVQNTRRNTPKNNTRFMNKLDRWLLDIAYIQDSLKQIEDKLIPKLEKILKIRFRNSELFLVAMFQPSTKNLFLELETQYRRSAEDPLGQDGFAEMINLSEMSKVLALVGDAVISSAVLQHLWEPHLGDAGKITQKKAEIVSNNHMAKLCDKWKLYEYRIHFDPETPSKSEMNHDKGTLLEAIYGIIYIEHEYKMIHKQVSHLINTR